MVNDQRESANNDELLEGLASVLDEGRSLQFVAGDFSLLEALKHPELEEVSGKAAIELHKLAEKVNVLVQRDDRFPKGRVLMVRGESGGGAGFFPHMVGSPLVRRVLQSGDPAEAIRWLQKVLAAVEADGQSITALWGVPVEQRISLTPTVDVVPIKDLPDSQQKEWITNLLIKGPQGPVMSGLDFDQPRSALVVCQRIEPFLYEPDNEPPVVNPQVAGNHEMLSEITLALTVVGPRVPIQAAHWFTFDDPDLEQANILSGGRHHPQIEILPLVHKPYPPLDPNEAKDLVGAYLALTGNTRNQVRVALQRLIQAQLRHNVGDRAVELSIALETLMGDKATTEMTHKVTVRSVRLLGGPPGVRRKNRRVITEAYNIRSKLVHGSHVKPTATTNIEGKRLTASAIIEAATAICVDLIKLIIHRGSIPDWSEFDIT
jgi:hypothetical protein